MTDQNLTSPYPDDDRAERALRLAFSTRADAVDATPLDPELLLAGRREDAGAAGTAKARRRRPAAWLSAAAAVAVVVLGVPIAFSLSGAGLRGQPSAASGGAAPAADTEMARDGAASRPADSPAYAPAGAAGTRPVSFLDVVVDVPAEWGYDFAPGSDWCAEPRAPRPAMPYVDRNPLSRAVRDIVCDGTIPDADQQTHLTWRWLRPGDVPTSVAAGSWTTISQPIGSAYVSVTAPLGSEHVASDILDSGRVVDVDPNGCPVRLPEGAPSEGRLDDLAGAATASVCQYALTTTGRPELSGSYSLDGDAADELFGRITGGAWADWVGEDLMCAPTGDVLLVRFTDAADAVRSVRFSLSDGCGFGWYDGVNARPPSQETCGDLFTGPLWLATTDPRWASVCRPR